MRLIRRALAAGPAASEHPARLPKPLPTRNPRVILVAQMVMELDDDASFSVPLAVRNWARLATGSGSTHD